MKLKQLFEEVLKESNEEASLEDNRLFGEVLMESRMKGFTANQIVGRINKRLENHHFFGIYGLTQGAYIYFNVIGDDSRHPNPDRKTAVYEAIEVDGCDLDFFSEKSTFDTPAWELSFSDEELKKIEDALNEKHPGERFKFGKSWLGNGRIWY